MPAAIPYQIVIITAPTKEEAVKIAETLVVEGLAACVNVLDGCTSFYRWKGEFVKDPEILMLAKIHRSKFKALEKRVIELHSYEVPEIIAFDLDSVGAGYRAFLEEALGK